jgi:hypothetical protein
VALYVSLYNAGGVTHSRGNTSWLLVPWPDQEISTCSIQTPVDRGCPRHPWRPRQAAEHGTVASRSEATASTSEYTMSKILQHRVASTLKVCEKSLKNYCLPTYQSISEFNVHTYVNIFTCKLVGANTNAYVSNKFYLCMRTEHCKFLSLIPGRVSASSWTCFKWNKSWQTLSKRKIFKYKLRQEFCPHKAA